MTSRKSNTTKMDKMIDKSIEDPTRSISKYCIPELVELIHSIDQDSGSDSDYAAGLDSETSLYSETSLDSERSLSSETDSDSRSGSDSEVDGDSESNSYSNRTEDSREYEELQDEDDESSGNYGRGEARISEDWATEGKIHQLQLDHNNDVVGENSASFGTYLGILAKDGNRLSLTYEDWRLVPYPAKNRIWEEVEGKTNLPPTYKKKCLQRVGKLWRDWKATLKAKYFIPYKHDIAYVARNVPARVEADQWPHLIRYWLSDKVKRRSKVNRLSRKKQEMPHRTGRSGIPNVRHELQMEMGCEPSKLDVYIRTREGNKKKRTSRPLDETTLKFIERANDLKEQLPEADRMDVSKMDEIYHTLVGPEKPGKRAYGSRATNTSMACGSSQMSVELTKFVEDSIKEKVNQLFDGMKSEIEKNILQMMDQRLPELIDKYRNFTSNPTLSNDQVTSSHAAEGTDIANKDVVNEDIANEADNDSFLNYENEADNDTLLNHEVIENMTHASNIPTRELRSNMTHSSKGFCIPTRELRSHSLAAQRTKNGGEKMQDGVMKLKRQKRCI